MRAELPPPRFSWAAPPRRGPLLLASSQGDAVIGPGADNPATLPADNEAALAAVATELERIAFGSLRLSIRDGLIVEVDILEKRRFP